ncbi:MAG: hypothetical protein IJU03_13135 [Thermoguttaceae bacterium]|nr:hypothetical protein [Thermoguttaceae bacterium]
MIENRTEPAFGAIRVGEPQTSSLRYQLLRWCKLIARNAVVARERGNRSELVDDFILNALEASSENACMDCASLAKLILKGDYILQLVEFLTTETTQDALAELETQVRDGVAAMEEPDAQLIQDLIAQGANYLPETRLATWGATRFGLHETIVAGLVGVATTTLRAAAPSKKAWDEMQYRAEGVRSSLQSLKPRERKEKRPEYLERAAAIEADAQAWRDEYRGVLDGVVDALAALSDDALPEETLCTTAMQVGKIAAQSLEIFERATTSQYGSPTPNSVSTTRKKGACVVFSGDDFEALSALLKQAEYSQIDVWTRGEAIAAFAYPCFASHRRLVGHYGGSWRNQQDELGAFPGSTVLASSPVEEPDDSYAPYVFTTTPTRFSSIQTIPRDADGGYNMTNVARAATDSSGFLSVKSGDKVSVGFGGGQVEVMVDRAARAFRTGQLKRVIAICGQDFASDAPDYFERLFAALPDTSVALTCGDVKFRFTIGQTSQTSYNVPKVIDVGRERDANAALRFASELDAELDRTAATSPTSFFVSLWGEASMAFALALASQGRKVVVGPYAPACWSPELTAIMKDRFGITVATDPIADLAD